MAVRLQLTSCTTLYIYKWKNHFYEMKGDVGMSLHEKERNKKMPTPRHKVTHNPIPTSLFVKVPVRGRVPYRPIAASRNSFESPSCAEYSAATVIAI